ncbi:MAG: PHP domain-containing protein [Deltaproteobacteria bacterium]|nr:PHP domain-containing protein [Deltaproteobacteria bacterium]MBW2081722.1 PHP domain-containing protein [Deltaproteobacteria bacterium]HDM10624.1 PHP domain-containing protein [Desulfobacteraceae bacterium]
MKIDLHIHSKDCSDGRLPLGEIFQIAHERGIKFISITDHDAIDCQGRAISLARKYHIYYLTGVELNINFSAPGYNRGKAISLDILGYGYNPEDDAIKAKTRDLREHREKRAREILQRINSELEKEGIKPLGNEDMAAIESSVDGAFGRPHIARYMVHKGLVKNVKEAFDKYLVRCDVPKFPLSLKEASRLIRNAGGKVVLAHGNDPNGTSLYSFTSDLEEQLRIVKDYMLEYLDGLECWHSRHDSATTDSYLAFARKHRLLVTGGSDCHQNPVKIGTLDIPSYVADQFQFI